MSLLRIAKWNYERNALDFKPELEHMLWAEEVNEFKAELKEYLSNPLIKISCIAGAIKEYCDCVFVYSGSLAKQLGHMSIENKQQELNIMNSYLMEILMKHKVKVYDEDSPSLIDLAMEAVIIANESKPKVKTKNKVVKGKDYVDPTVFIMELLLDRGFQEYPGLEEKQEVETKAITEDK